MFFIFVVFSDFDPKMKEREMKNVFMLIWSIGWIVIGERKKKRLIDSAFMTVYL